MTELARKEEIDRSKAEDKLGLFRNFMKDIATEIREVELRLIIQDVTNERI